MDNEFEADQITNDFEKWDGSMFFNVEMQNKEKTCSQIRFIPDSIFYLKSSDFLVKQKIICDFEWCNNNLLRVDLRIALIESHSMSEQVSLQDFANKDVFS